MELKKCIQQQARRRYTLHQLESYKSYKPFYFLRSSENEKKSCLCVNCLNPHVIIKATNGHRISKKLNPGESLSSYLKQLTAGEKSEKADDKIICKFYQYKWVTESLLAKKEKSLSMTR